MFYDDLTPLVEAIQHIDDAEERMEKLHRLEKDLHYFPAYVNQVCATLITDRMAGIRLKTGDWDTAYFQDVVQDADKLRKEKHDLAIDATHRINRSCRTHDVPEICPETDDRQTIGDFCAKVTAEMFLVGTNRDYKTLDAVIEALDNGSAHIDMERSIMEIER